MIKHDPGQANNGKRPIMASSETLWQDHEAISGGNGVPWNMTESEVDIGKGVGMVPLVGLPQDVVDEIDSGAAKICAIIPSEDQLLAQDGPRAWVYWVKRADGRVTVASHGGTGLSVEVANIVPGDFPLALSKWLAGTNRAVS